MGGGRRKGAGGKGLTGRGQAERDQADRRHREGADRKRLAETHPAGRARARSGRGRLRACWWMVPRRTAKRSACVARSTFATCQPGRARREGHLRDVQRPEGHLRDIPTRPNTSRGAPSGHAYAHPRHPPTASGVFSDARAGRKMVAGASARSHLVVPGVLAIFESGTVAAAVGHPARRHPARNGLHETVPRERARQGERPPGTRQRPERPIQLKAARTTQPRCQAMLLHRPAPPRPQPGSDG